MRASRVSGESKVEVDMRSQHSCYGIEDMPPHDRVHQTNITSSEEYHSTTLVLRRSLGTQSARTLPGSATIHLVRHHGRLINSLLYAILTWPGNLENASRVGAGPEPFKSRCPCLETGLQMSVRFGESMPLGEETKDRSWDGVVTRCW
jgi:hypothetical protein